MIFMLFILDEIMKNGFCPPPIPPTPIRTKVVSYR